MLNIISCSRRPVLLFACALTFTAQALAQEPTAAAAVTDADNPSAPTAEVESLSVDPVEVEPVEPPLTAPSSSLSSELRSLEALDRALSSKEHQVRQVQQQLIAAEDSVTQQELTEQLRELKSELEKQRRQFEKFAVNIDLRPFIDEEAQAFNWQNELSKLLKPIIAELENATKESRAIGELRAQINEVEERKTLATEAAARLNTLLAQQPSPALRTRLQTRLDEWQRIATDTNNRYAALELQLNKRLAERESVLEETTDYAKRFVRTRGLNLVMAISAFALVFIGVRWLANAVRRFSPKATEKAFSTRLTTLLLHVFSVLGGLVAMMLVFNLAGDWFMLGIILIFLIGIGWASIHTLPSQLETVRLILNIGPVREGEHLLFNGLPYRVDSLAFTARLVNPLLDGGLQQMPVKHLVGHISRPVGAAEPWFPTQTGDWVELADGHLGRVMHQSPSRVILREPGGAEVTYLTDRFVALNPRKLSDGFRISTRFGIDRQHQAIATTEVPEQMHAALEQGLAEVLEQATPQPSLQSLQVRFAQATEATLEYLIYLDLSGAAAPLVPTLHTDIQRILIDTCNAQGWHLPLNHIGVHQLSN